MPVVQCSVFFSLDEMLPGYNTVLDLKRGNERVSQSDCKGRKKKKRDVPHFKMGGGRKMDELRKMNLWREMSFFKMSDHAFPFILLTDFFRIMLSKLRWQMKQRVCELLAGGSRRSVFQSESLESRTLVFLQQPARRCSLTWITLATG